VQGWTKGARETAPLSRNLERALCKCSLW